MKGLTKYENNFTSGQRGKGRNCVACSMMFIVIRSVVRRQCNVAHIVIH